MYVKRIRNLVLSSLVFSTGMAIAADTPGGGPFSLGLILGTPTAITGKYDLSSRNAVDVGLSFFYSYSALVYSDYQWKFPGRFGNKNKFFSQTTPYIGVGGGIYSWNSYARYGDRPWGWNTNDSSGVGLYGRVPLGAEWLPKNPPLGVFAEVAPGLALLPGMGITFDIGVGARYYF